MSVMAAFAAGGAAPWARAEPGKKADRKAMTANKLVRLPMVLILSPKDNLLFLFTVAPF
jgi:hypothetical protein